MVKIVKDGNEKVVTKGAYNSFYKHLGYTIMSDSKKSTPKVDVKQKEVTKEKTKDDNEGKEENTKTKDDNEGK